MARSIGECPAGPSSEACASSWSRFQVVNAPGPAFIYGVEAALRFRPVDFFPCASDVRLDVRRRAELGGSRPLGAVSRSEPRASYFAHRANERHGRDAVVSFLGSFYAGWALRWALEQTRLSVSDRADYRIPNGGTPGFAIFDLRAGYRYRRILIVNVVLENLMNRPYRAHGFGAERSRCAASVSEWRSDYEKVHLRSSHSPPWLPSTSCEAEDPLSPGVARRRRCEREATEV